MPHAVEKTCRDFVVKWSQKSGGGGGGVRQHIGALGATRAHFGAFMPDSLASSPPPSPTAGAGAPKREARQTPEKDAQQCSRRKVRLSREYVLIWLLQQRLRAVSWPHQHAATARPQRGSSQAMMVALTRRPLSSACHTRFMCSAHAVLCLVPPAVDLHEALGRCVCVRDGLAAYVCDLRICHTSADPVELLPGGWRDVAFPRWLHVQSCSMWLMLVVASAACVYETGSLLLFAHVALLLLSLSFYLAGLARRRFPSVASCSKLLDVAFVAHYSLLHQLL